MNGENITVNGEPLHNYLDQQEGKEIEEVRKESIGEIKKTLGSGVHSNCRVRGNGSNYQHGPVTRLNRKGIEERYSMQKDNTTILERALQKLAASPSYLRVDQIAEGIAANRSSTQADLIRCHKTIPELITKKYDSFMGGRYTVYSLTKAGFDMGPTGVYQAYLNSIQKAKLNKETANLKEQTLKPSPIDIPCVNHFTRQPTQLEIAVQELLEYFDQNKVELIPWSLLTQLKKLSSL